MVNIGNQNLKQIQNLAFEATKPKTLPTVREEFVKFLQKFIPESKQIDCGYAIEEEFENFVEELEEFIERVNSKD